MEKIKGNERKWNGRDEGKSGQEKLNVMNQRKEYRETDT